MLVARTNLTGLVAAQVALGQWASPATRPPVRLLGLVLLADAPGKLSRPLRDFTALIAGGAPATWNVGWVEAWRTDPVDPSTAPSSLTRMVADLHRLATEHPAAATTPATSPPAPALRRDPVMKEG